MCSRPESRRQSFEDKLRADALFRWFARNPVSCGLIGAVVLFAFSPFLVLILVPGINLEAAKNFADITQNIAASLGVLGGVAVAVKWVYDRHDRATDMLIQLNERFVHPDLSAGKACFGGCCAAELSEAETRALDPVLGFYVMLCGIREANQVPDRALSLSFAWWLSHYYRHDSRTLRIYINTYYPTLRQWLEQDLENPEPRRFFRAHEFWRQDDYMMTLPPRTRVLVLTGAGASADSGIPTFRGAEGYWRKLDPQKLATATAFAEDPALVWEWYRERRERIRKASPNAAHVAITRLGLALDDFLLLTQNVDNLHFRATSDGRSLPSRAIVEIHGNIFRTRCTRCDYRREDLVKDEPGVPSCPHCGGPLRPDVVWFDEELDPVEVHRVESFLARGRCDYVLVVGTTATFSYIVDWANRARGSSGWLMEVNPVESGVTHLARERLHESAATAVPRIVSQWLEQP